MALCIPTVCCLNSAACCDVNCPLVCFVLDLRSYLIEYRHYLVLVCIVIAASAAECSLLPLKCALTSAEPPGCMTKLGPLGPPKLPELSVIRVCDPGECMPPGKYTNTYAPPSPVPPQDSVPDSFCSMLAVPPKTPEPGSAFSVKLQAVAANA